MSGYKRNEKKNENVVAINHRSAIVVECGSAAFSTDEIDFGCAQTKGSLDRAFGGRIGDGVLRGRGANLVICIACSLVFLSKNTATPILLDCKPRTPTTLPSGSLPPPMSRSLLWFATPSDSQPPPIGNPVPRLVSYQRVRSSARRYRAG